MTKSYREKTAHTEGISNKDDFGYGGGTIAPRPPQNTGGLVSGDASLTEQEIQQEREINDALVGNDYSDGFPDIRPLDVGPFPDVGPLPPFTINISDMIDEDRLSHTEAEALAEKLKATNRIGEPLTSPLQEAITANLKRTAPEHIEEAVARLMYEAASNKRNRAWDESNANLPEEARKCKYIALMHRELSEVLQAVRTGEMDKHLPQYKAEGVELADVLIYLVGYADSEGIPLPEIVVAKMEYNRTRKDHSPEERAKDGGKKF